MRTREQAIKGSSQPMDQQQILNAARHPAVAVAAAAVFALATLAVIRGGVDARARVAAEDDPVKISDQALERTFSRDVAEREIRAALAAGDADLAQSFLELAADRDVIIDSTLANQVRDVSARTASLTNTAGRFVHGLWTGEPTDMASLAGTAAGDLFVFGDIRDAAREGTRYLTGQHADPWVLGLAGVGLAITAGTYASAGVATPARIGLSVVKAARRTGRLTARMTGWIGRSLSNVVDWGAFSRVSLSHPALAVRAAREAVKVEEAGGLVDLVSDIGRVESKAGTQAALDSLQVAEGPRDISRLARLAAAKGGKTRAIVKLLGRAAIMLTMSAFDLAMWLFWAAFMLLGFAASCKAAAERMTLRYIRWRKARRVWRAELQFCG
jgi:hypothetical protein